MFVCHNSISTIAVSRVRHANLDGCLQFCCLVAMWESSKRRLLSSQSSVIALTIWSMTRDRYNLIGSAGFRVEFKWSKVSRPSFCLCTHVSWSVLWKIRGASLLNYEISIIVIKKSDWASMYLECLFVYFTVPISRSIWFSTPLLCSLSILK